MNQVVPDNFKGRVGKKMSDVVLGSGEEIVQADHLSSRSDQAITQVAPQEARSSGDQDSST
jgi:hypothetical protein